MVLKEMSFSNVLFAPQDDLQDDRNLRQSQYYLEQKGKELLE
jgi:hypothetical protein